MGVHHPNARIGIPVCGIAARHDEGEVAPLSVQRKLDPEHRQRLKQARGLQLAGIDGLEAHICDNAQHGLFIGTAGACDKHDSLAFGEARLRHHADARAAEGLVEFRLARLTLEQLGARRVEADRKPGERRIDRVGRVDDDLAANR